MASVTVDIQAKVVGYEASLKAMKDAFSRIDPGTEIGKSLEKAIKYAENQLKGLNKNLTPRATSDTQIDAIIEKTNRAGEAIQEVTNLMQKVSIGDIDFSKFDSGIGKLMESLSTLEDELGTRVSEGFKKAIEGSTELSEAFKNFNIDIKDKSAGAIFEEVSEKAKQAAADTEAAKKVLDAAQKDLNSKQTKLSQLESNPIYNKDALKQDLNNLASEYIKTFDSIKETIRGNLNNLLGGNEAKADKMMEAFTQGLSSQTLKDHLMKLKDSLQKELKEGNSAKDIYSALLGGDVGSSGNAQAVTTKLLAGLNKVLPTIKEEFQTKFQDIISSLTTKEAGNISVLMDEGDLEGALKTMLKAIERAYSTAVGEVKKGQQAVADAMKEKASAQEKYDTAASNQENIDGIVAQLTQQLKDVQEQNKDLQNQINELKSQISEKKSSAASKIRSDARENGLNVENWKIGQEEAKKYQTELDRVQAKEKLVGKVEGVVQRWFSIYAAVRMVGNAIRSVISTVQELDKTITEIAIVTNMTQDELWGQMKSYTDMARQYAASISGVYQVSQLYYQQGLQTADVMALTEETLKMARISGLGYAEATDYMTNAVRSFKMEMTDAQRVVDVYSEIAASSATSTSELASAMSKTASSAQAVGSSFENTTAMMAVMIEATRESAENIGSAMKSIISRYGEMTTDPAKLMDSEGQEMSLNKVDKALKSVGITIQDSNHQFRDFDEVITELAGKWDTIDTNTQRYIATVMAGNRQQSRFLALVSNGERLAELSEKAANSEDAATLQVLKTMDSIEAKTQQFKTSLQSLYTDTGVQNFFKGLLDLGNNIVKTFTEMPRIFNLPIPAIIKFGAQFYTLSSVVLNAFSMIKAGLSKKMSENSLLLKAAQQEELTQAEQTALNRILTEQRKQKGILDAQRQGEQARLADQKTHDQEQIDEAEAAAQRQVDAANKTLTQRKHVQIGGMIASTAGLALSTIAGNMNVNQSRGLKAGFTAASAALQGLGTGLMIGGVPGAIMGAFNSLPGIIEAIGMASESTEERISRLGAAITEVGNKELQSKDELKTLTDFKQKYDELAKSRYKDSDSRQAWLDLNNSIAQSYPQFISYIDEEGNKIVNLGENYNQLLAVKQAVYEADNLQASVAQLEALSDIDYVMQSLLDASAHVKTSDEGFKIFGQSTILSSADAHDADFAMKWLSEVNKEIEQANGNFEKFQELFESVHGQSFDYVRNALLNSATFEVDYTNILGLGDHHNMDLAVAGAMGSYLDQIANNWDLYNNQVSDYIQSQVKLLASYFGNKASYDFTSSGVALDQVSTELNKKWQDALAQGQVQGLDLSTIYSNFYANIPKYLQEINDRLFSNFNFSDSNTTLAQAEKIFQNPENFSKIYLENLSEDIKNIFTDEQLQNITDKAAENYTSAVDQVNNLILDSLDAGDIKFDQYTLDVAHYNEMLGNVAGQYYDSYIEQLAALLSSQNYSSEAKQAAMNKMYFLRGAIQEDNNLNEVQMNEVDQILSSADLTSLTGINELEQALEGLSFITSDLDFSFLTGNIIPNLVIEYSALETKLSGNLSDVEKALGNAADGMDTKTALEMATKLGATLKDFEFKNGKWFYTDTTQLLETYEKVDSNLIEQINAAYDRTIDLISPLEDLVNSPFNTGFNVFNGVYTNESNQSVTFSALSEKNQLNAIKLNLGVNDPQAEQILGYYKQYYQDFLNSADEYNNNFWTYVREQLENSRENFEAALDAEDFIANSKLLSNGDFIQFLSKFNFTDELQQTLLQDFLAGNIENLLLWIPEKYHSTLINTLENINNNVLQNIFAGAKEGSYIKSTEATDVFYAALTQGENALLEKIANNTYKFIGDSYDALIARVNASNLTDNQKQSLLKDIHTEQYKDNLYDSLNDVIDNYDNISYDAMQSLANALDMSVDWLTGGGIFDDVAPFSVEDNGNYKADLERLDEFLTYQYGKLSNESYNKIRAQLEQAKFTQNTDNVIRNIINKREQLTSEDIGNLATALGEKYEELVTRLQLQQNDDGTYRMSLDTLWNQFAGQMNDTLMEYVASEIDKVISSMTNLSADQSKGYTSIENIQKYADSLKQQGITKIDGTDFDLKDLFEYNDTLQAYQLTTTGIIAQIASVKKQIQPLIGEQRAIAEQFMQNTAKQFADNIDLQSLVNADLGSAEAVKATATISKAVDNYNSVLKAMAEEGEKVATIDADALIDSIGAGGEAAVIAAQKIAELQGKTLSADEIEGYYRREIQHYVNVIDQVTARPGEIVDAITASIIGLNNVDQLGTTGQYVIKSAANLYEAYNKLLQRMALTGEATLADLNKVAALALENRDGEQQVIDALGDAAGMTFTRFGEILANAGIQLTENMVDDLEASGVIGLMGGNKMKIVDFQAFADLMQWDANSEEYISAFKSYNDSLIEMNRQAERNILEEVESIADAKGGDWLNITQLMSKLQESFRYEGSEKISLGDSLEASIQKFGAKIEDGILKLDDSANISAIMQEIAKAAAESGGLLSNELAELADTVADVIKGYADLISGAISGSLSNTQAEELQDWASTNGIGKLNFTETADGLKVATDQAFELVAALRQVDSMQGKLTFDNLVDSLSADKGGRFENISKTTAEIANKRREIAKVSEDIATIEKRSAENQGQMSSADKEKLASLRDQKKELNDQLNLYTQIQQHQSIDPAQYNFMDRDLPDTMQGPINYWNSVGQAFSAMNESSKTGRMEIQDFYNIVNEMENLANTSGQVFDLAGYKIGGSASEAAKLIQDGMGALDNIDGKGVKVNLQNLGVDFASGADGAKKNFADGVHALAESQVAMLDAAIQVLEVVVAMEKLGDIDVDSNNVFSIGDIFKLDDKGNPIPEYTAEFKQYAADLLEAAKTNEDLRKGLENFSVNGVSLKEMFEDATDGIKDLNISEEAYFAVMEAFVNAAKNGDYNLDTIQDSVWEILDKTLPDGSVIDMGDRSIVISGGTHTVIDWENPNVQAVIDDIGGEEKEARNKLLESFQKWQNGTSEKIDMERVLQAEGKLKVDKKTGKVTYNGKEYSNMDAAMPDIAKDALKEMGAEGPFNFEGEGENLTVTSDLKVGQHTIQVKFQNNKKIYVDPETGMEAGSLKELVDKIINTKTNEFEKSLHGNATPQQVKEYREKLQAQLYFEYEISGTETNISGTDEQIRQLLEKSNEEIQAAIDAAIQKGPGTDGKYHAKFDDSEVEIEFSDKDLNSDAVKQKAIEHFQNSGIIAAIGEGVKSAFKGDTTIQDAISGAIQSALGIGEQAGENGSGGISISGVTLSPQGLTIDLSNAGDPTLKGAEEETQDISIAEVTLKPTKVSLDTAGVEPTTEEGETPQEVPIGKVTLKPTAVEVSTENLDMSGEETEDSSLTIKKTIEIDDEQATKDIEALDSAAEESKEKTVTTNTTDADKDVADLNAEANADASKIVSVSVTLPEIWDKLDDTVSKTVKVSAQKTGTWPDGVWPTGATTGNVALSKGNLQGRAYSAGNTLMGELGPEMVVSHGRYFVVGQNGPEMVNLAEDAIVFNHLQTEQLLRHGKASGHAKPVTNERKATSLATGNVGPAMASASAALAALKQLRAMWQSLLNASLKDLGGLAGGSGGGGGGGGGDDATKGVLGNIERWYNYLQLIESTQVKINKLTKDYTLLEKQGASSNTRLDKLKEEYKLLKENKENREKLVEEQTKYRGKLLEQVQTGKGKYGLLSAFYDGNPEDGTLTLKSDEDFQKFVKKRGTGKTLKGNGIEVRKRSFYSEKEAEEKNKEIEKYNKDNEEAIKKGEKKAKKTVKAGDVKGSKKSNFKATSGIELFNKLQKTDQYGNLVYSAKDQLKILEDLGLGKYLEKDASGNKLKTAEEKVEYFFAQIESGPQEFDALTDSINDQEQAALDDAISMQEINEQIREMFTPVTGVTDSLEKWYNQLKKIEAINNKLNVLNKNNEILQRDQIANGEKIYNNYKDQIKQLEKKKAANEALKNQQIDERTNLVNQYKDLPISYNKKTGVATFSDKKYNQKIKTSYTTRKTNDKGYEVDENGNYKDKKGVLRNSKTGKEVKDKEYGQTQTETVSKTYNAKGKTLPQIIEEITAQDEKGRVAYNAEQQYQIIKALGLEKFAKYDESGNKIYDRFGDLSQEEMESIVKAAISRIQNSADSINDATDSINNLTSENLDVDLELLDIQETFRQNIIEVENLMKDAVIQEHQDAIDQKNELKDAIDKAASKTVKGLRDSLDKERQTYDSDKDDKELTNLYMQLAAARAGGSAAQIDDLQQKIQDKRQEIYFNQREQAIDEIEESANKQIEALSEQTDIMQTALDYQVKYGIILKEVNKHLRKWTTDQIGEYILKQDPNYLGKTQEEKNKFWEDLKQTIQQYTAKRDDDIQTEADNKQKAKEVTGIINKLPETAGLVNKKEVTNARKAYDSLTEDQKKLVKNKTLKRLTDAETQVKAAEEKEAKRVAARNTTINGELDKIAKNQPETFSNENFRNKVFNVGVNTYEKTKGTEEEKVAAAKTAMKQETNNIYATAETSAEKITQQVADQIRQKYGDGIVNNLAKKYYSSRALSIYLQSGGDESLTKRQIFDVFNGEVGNEINIRANEAWKAFAKRNNISTIEDTSILARLKGSFINAYNQTQGSYKDRKQAAEIAALDVLHLKGVKRYATGGEIDYTGLAWVDGSKTKPEHIFNDQQMEFLKSGLYNNVNLTNSLVSSLGSILDKMVNNDTYNSINNSDSVIIERAEVNLKIDEVASDYDARRIGQQAMNEMVRIARKSGNQSISRR